MTDENFAYVVTLFSIVWIAIISAIGAWIYGRKGRSRWSGAWIGVAIAVLVSGGSAFLSFFVFFPAHLLLTGIAAVVGAVISLPIMWRVTPRMTRRCPNCANTLRANVQFCPNCGHEFPRRPETKLIRRIRLLAVGVATLFVGAIAGATLLDISGLARTRMIYPSIDDNSLEAVPQSTAIPLTRIVVASHDIVRGKVITREDIDTQPWPINAVDSDHLSAQEYYTNPTIIVGKIARTDIWREQPILLRLLVDDSQSLASVGPIVQPIYPKGNLLYDQPVRGTIDEDNWREEWSFVGAAYDTISISIETTAGNLVPFIMLWSEKSGTWIDGKRTFPANQATLTVTLLQRNDIYIAVVSRNGLDGGKAGGFYCLMLTHGATPSVCSGKVKPG